MKHKCLLRIQNLHTFNQVRTKRLHCSIIYIFLNILVKALCCYLLWLSNEKRKYTKNCYFAPYPGLDCLQKSQNLHRFNQDRTKRFFYSIEEIFLNILLKESRFYLLWFRNEKQKCTKSTISLKNTQNHF